MWSIAATTENIHSKYEEIIKNVDKRMSRAIPSMEDHWGFRDIVHYCAAGIKDVCKQFISS